MLVLSRHKDESIMVGDNVEITIVDVRGDKVRLGITAPREIPVHRFETLMLILQENGRLKKMQQEGKLPAGNIVGDDINSSIIAKRKN